MCVRRGWSAIVVALFLMTLLTVEALSADDTSSAPAFDLLIEPAAPAIQAAPVANSEPGVRWSGVLNQSLRLLALEHGFRLLTEPGTRSGMNQVPRGYLNSAGNLHGWADGDEFYVNYAGHPMQGAVAGFIWTQNDPKYWDVEFGRNRRYWKSRLRAAMFAWAYSVQFEIGPLSEASVGQVQALYPQQGLVDQAVTPAIGMGWMLAEDAIDKYIIKRVEARTANKYVRLFVRGGLNPSRSMANVLGGRVPWERDDRRGVFRETEDDFVRRAGPKRAPESVKPPPMGVAPFEFTMAFSFRTFTGPPARGSCLGGGGSASFRIAQAWQLVADATGFRPVEPVHTGHGRRTTAHARENVPYGKTCAGIDRGTQGPPPARALGVYGAGGYQWLFYGCRSRFGCEAHGGSALRVASLDYTCSRVNSLGGISYRSDMHFGSGLVFRFGTW